METLELTDHIKNYLENDKTRSAIMLTGPWGCGKSYYIQNTLIPALIKDNVSRCIVVSLYGLKNLEALSKNIYLEVRAKALFKKSETVSAAKIFGKTILKGVASFFGVDINVSEDDLNKLYQSIDLTDKLIVLEDLERSGINIIEIMGYVNNLVEQDGVKVLLVANENEIIKYEDKEEKDKDKDKDNKIIKVPTETTEEYLRIKEKTVNDTISFYADLNDSVENILRLFNNHYFNEALKEKINAGIPLIIDEIVNVMFEVKCYNLRALLYSCQKTLEMFLKSHKDCAISYFRFVLCSNTAFALRLSQNCSLEWTDNIKSPNELGSYHFPLYRCCYDYIKRQFFDGEQFIRDESVYIQQKNFGAQQENLQHSLEILYYFFIHSENEVSNAIREICKYLKESQNYIPLEQYGRLSNSLIATRKYIDDENLIDECKREILKKLQCTPISNDIIHDLTYHEGFELWTEQQKDEYISFKQEMLKELKTENPVVSIKISTIEDIQKLIKSIYSNIKTYTRKRSFAAQLDIEGILKTLPECTPKIISGLRGAFIGLYRHVNINDFLLTDKSALVSLKEGLEKIITLGKVGDKIKRLQLEWFVNSIEEILPI